MYVPDEHVLMRKVIAQAVYAASRTVPSAYFCHVRVPQSEILTAVHACLLFGTGTAS